MNIVQNAGTFFRSAPPPPPYIMHSQIAVSLHSRLLFCKNLARAIGRCNYHALAKLWGTNGKNPNSVKAIKKNKQDQYKVDKASVKSISRFKICCLNKITFCGVSLWSILSENQIPEKEEM